MGLLDMSSFLFDLNRLYVISFKARRGDLAVGYGRNSFRLSRQYQLEVASVKFQSPGELILIAAAIPPILGSVWIALQIIEKADIWRLTRRKMGLEISKLEREEHEYYLTHGTGSKLPGFRGDSTVFMSFDDVPGYDRDGGRRLRLEPVFDHPTTRSVIWNLEANPLKPSNVVVEVSHRLKPEIY